MLDAVFSVIRTATVATQRRGKQGSKTREELCFLGGLFRRVINRTSLEFNSVVGYVTEGKEVNG
jgi:hypothetical protein